ncbi:hypothetical protein F5Y09DRAFT_202344 [Xylaria sp. FL1042]|nr:hypothetical protein F5Y09DRAFT_202344 [Xylaria sp. FL1042]
MDASLNPFTSYSCSKKTQLNSHRYCPKPSTSRIIKSSPSSSSSSMSKSISPPRYARPTAASIARSFSTLPDNPIPTNPVYIAQLWRKVMPYNSTTQSSRQRQIILEPCGIILNHKYHTNRLYDYMKLSQLELPEIIKERFAKYENKQPSADQQPSTTLQPGLRIWRDSTDNKYLMQLQNAYSSLSDFTSNEAEYQAYALSNILVDELLYRKDTHFLDQHLEPVRLLQNIQKPDERWQKPPLLSPSSKNYRWDIRPDCAYYISLKSFPRQLHGWIRRRFCVFSLRAISSYLTIEFKKDDESGKLTKAENQIAVASAIALYNRWYMKSEALKIYQRKWEENDKSQMQHFGIVSTGSQWDLWCMKPKTFDTWTGCTMVFLTTGDFQNNTEELLDYLNMIHCWGLMVHGRSVVADIVDLNIGGENNHAILPYR